MRNCETKKFGKIILHIFFQKPISCTRGVSNEYLLVQDRNSRIPNGAVYVKPSENGDADMEHGDEDLTRSTITTSVQNHNNHVWNCQKLFFWFVFCEESICKLLLEWSGSFHVLRHWCHVPGWHDLGALRSVLKNFLYFFWKLFLFW